MARTTESRANRRKSASRAEVNGSLEEHRIETPRPDLVVLRIGRPVDNLKVLPKERASGVVAKVAKAMAKPGLTRAQIFQGASDKVFAYSLYSKDPSKFVREDASGHKILGRFMGGRFRPLSSSPAL
jgi:hypothetical protein